jgi:hypothetical protein
MSTEQVKRTSEKKPSKLKRLFTGRTKSKKNGKADRSTAGDASEAGDVSIYENRTLGTAPESPAHGPSFLSKINDVGEEHDEVTTLPSPSLQVVLLLMDPSSRRFELLQLEFDSEKAKVSDIMAQIPISVTEDVIRKQKYQGVVDARATHMGKNARLADFCSKKEVLVALPQDVSVRDCIKLARPILSDDKVVAMVSLMNLNLVFS